MNLKKLCSSPFLRHLLPRNLKMYLLWFRKCTWWVVYMSGTWWVQRNPDNIIFDLVNCPKRALGWGGSILITSISQNRACEIKFFKFFILPQKLCYYCFYIFKGYLSQNTLGCYSFFYCILSLYQEESNYFYLRLLMTYTYSKNMISCYFSPHFINFKTIKN